jgi:hypothetical protein
MKKIKFKDTVFIKNVKLTNAFKRSATPSLMKLINKTPSTSVLDEVRSITKTDALIVDYSKKYYGVNFFNKIKTIVQEYGRLKNHAEIRIVNYCFVKMKSDDQIDYHSSFESNFVGIYLLEDSEKKHHITFYDNDTNKDIKIPVKKNDLILFPAHLLRKFSNLKTKKEYTYIIFDFHLDKPRINVKK